MFRSVSTRCRPRKIFFTSDPAGLNIITTGASMIPVRELFESHLTVVDLHRSMNFFSEVLGLKLAAAFLEQKVAFYWIGGPGTSILGLWKVGTGPQG
jgi:hypothetical protein